MKRRIKSKFRNSHIESTILLVSEKDPECGSETLALLLYAGSCRSLGAGSV
jgi:hypothetical protein